jgi:hypothetical protein
LKSIIQYFGGSSFKFVVVGIDWLGFIFVGVIGRNFELVGIDWHG